jgi:6-pyruvoyltetrahydropterin/6-carboxytetrahydropterin synthase
VYEILISANFSSAHNLRGYKGKCEELHGHNWKVEVVFQKQGLDKIGMTVDFTLLKKRLKDILKELDHKYLNKISFFKKNNPSAENIARYIYKEFKRYEGEVDIMVKSVNVWESEKACARYYE